MLLPDEATLLSPTAGIVSSWRYA